MRTMKKVATLALACSMAVTSASVPASAAKKVNVKKVAVESSLSGDSKTVYVAKGKTVKLKSTVTVTPDKSANKGVTYKSSNKKVATVTNKGVVKGVKTGTAKITVTSKKNTKKSAAITVQVKKAAVSKIVLDQETAALKTGDKVTLKATVTAGKKACKKVAWTSSDKKVATVTKKGVVKAKAAGTVTITAKAIDGSGKKATCKVTVEESNSITAMDVLNEQTITFALKNAQQIAADQITIKTKKMADGEYKNALKIDSVTSPDGINYTVVVNSNTRISKNDFVQVSIAGVADPIEKQYTEQVCAFTEDRIIVWNTEEYNEALFSFGEAQGYSEYAITGVPAGLTVSVKEDGVWVKGTPSAAGTTNAVVTAKDELGNTYTQNITFAIGSDKVLAGAALVKYSLTSAKNSTIQTVGDVAGGCGYYRYEIIADPQNTKAEITKNTDQSFTIKANLTTAGDYTIKVRAIDNDDASKYCDMDVVFHVAQGIAVEGCVKDAQGNAMLDDAQVTFTNKNRADRYFKSYTFGVDDETGKYAAVVAAGSYDIAASHYEEAEAGNAAEYLYNQSFSADSKEFNIALPLYKVEFTSADTKMVEDLKYRSWTMNNDAVGSGSVIYVKAGNYNFETGIFTENGIKQTTEDGNWFEGYVKTVLTPSKTYKYTATANVVNAGVKVAVTKNLLKDNTSTTVDKCPAAKDTPHKVTELGKTYNMSDTYESTLYNFYNAYTFEPEEDGVYELEATGSTKIAFYNGAGEVLEATDGQYSLKKGTTYYIGTGSTSTPSVTFSVKKVNAQ